MIENFYGSKTEWFLGIVKENVDQSLVRVRIFGVHNMEDEVKISDTDLPIAIVLMPATGAQSSSGSPQHNLEVGSWVVGLFADPKYKQQPIIIGVVQGSDYSLSDQNSTGSFNTDTGTDGDYSDIDINKTTNIPGNSNVAKAYNYIYDKLKAEGASDPHLLASAAVGVLKLETTGINPASGGGYKGRAWGICQWLGGRKTQLFRKFGQTKDLGNQLDFMWWELNNGEGAAKRKWLASKNMPDAVAGFASFERAEEWTKQGTINRGHPNYRKRLKYAYETYNSIKR